MNYLEQMNRAVEYIEKNLSAELAVENISKEAGISKWHFQRVFRAMIGETVMEYAQKRRLSQAAELLCRSEKNILEVALEYQFESHEAFTRAFKKFFTVSPSEFRKSLKNSSMIPQRPKITVEYINHLYKGISMEPKIIKLNEMNAVGVTGIIKSVQSPEFSQNFEKVPLLWKKLSEKADSVAGNAKFKRISLIDTTDKAVLKSDLDDFAGIILEDGLKKPSDLEARTVQAGEYAEFTHKGPMRSVNHTMNYIYGSWLPKSGRKRREGPEVTVYTERIDPNSPDNVVKILVPLV